MQGNILNNENIKLDNPKLKNRNITFTIDDDIGQHKILKKNNLNTSKNKSVKWDWKSLEEQEQENLKTQRRKIDEPKTPYLPYDEGDNEYLKKLNEINKIQPTKEILEEVCKQLEIEREKEEEEEKEREREMSNNNISNDKKGVRFGSLNENKNIMEVEDNQNDKNSDISLDDDNISKILIKYFIVEKNEFLNRRQNAYKNEFLLAKRHSEKMDDEDDEESIMNETLKNTLFNKLYGKIDKGRICKNRDKDFD